MAISSKNVHMLAHAARMQQVLAEDPEHARKDAYAEKLTEYKAEWAPIAPEDRAAMRVIVAENYADITESALDAAMTALGS